MVFCNIGNADLGPFYRTVTILILIDGFLQFDIIVYKQEIKQVTILILIDGFLQYKKSYDLLSTKDCHNPYFNRWFSAIHYKYAKNFPEEESQSLF